MRDIWEAKKNQREEWWEGSKEELGNSKERAPCKKCMIESYKRNLRNYNYQQKVKKERESSRWRRNSSKKIYFMKMMKRMKQRGTKSQFKIMKVKPRKMKMASFILPLQVRKTKNLMRVESRLQESFLSLDAKFMLTSRLKAKSFGLRRVIL